MSINLSHNLCKVGGSRKTSLANSILIALENSINTLNLRIEDVTIESEAVRCFVVHWAYSSKAIEWELFIRIIIFQDAAYSFYNIIILIALWMPVMERLRTLWVSITCREVNSYLQSDFAASKDVVQETFSLLDDDVIDEK